MEDGTQQLHHHRDMHEIFNFLEVFQKHTSYLMRIIGFYLLIVLIFFIQILKTKKPLMITGFLCLFGCQLLLQCENIPCIYIPVFIYAKFSTRSTSFPFKTIFQHILCFHNVLSCEVISTLILFQSYYITCTVLKLFTRKFCFVFVVFLS